MSIIGSVLYLDPFERVEIPFDGKSFEIKADKKSYITSRVSYSDIVLHSFKVPSTIKEDELKSSVEIKMYEDAGLDLQKRYKIAYVKKELDFEENILVEAFAIEIDKITASLSEVLRHSKFIDFLALPFLSFTTLYRNKIIAPKNDLFLYIDEHEAFLSIYKDSKYLSTKSIMSLEEMSKSLANSGIEISPTELKEHLHAKGLDPSLYERGESLLFNALEEIFSTMFTKINDIVVYNRSIFGFENIDRIFLSMQNGRIKGIKEFITNFGFADVEVLDFNLFKEKAEGNYFKRIVTSYAYDKLIADDMRHNLSVFDREPPFYKKESGKTIIVAASVLLVTLAFIGALFYESTVLEQQKETLELQYNAMKKSEQKYKAEIAKVDKELKELNTQKEKQKTRVDNITQSISRLEALSKDSHDYSEFILDINTLLQKYALSTTQIELNDKKTMSISIVAEQSKRDAIAKFMEDLIEKGYISVTTDEIKSDSDIYYSKIEIKR